MADRVGHIWQAGRGRRMLPPEVVEIDARGDAEMLLYMNRIARQLTFLDGREEQSWAAFLDRDPIFLVAEIAARLTRNSYYAHRGSGSMTVARVLDEDQELIESWIKRAGPFPELHRALMRVKELQRADRARMAEDLGIADAPEARRMLLAASTDLNAPLPGLAALVPVLDPQQSQLSAQLLSPLDREIMLLGDEAARTLREALTRRSDHSPHVGLLLAFLRMRDVTRQHINKIADAHLTYFYEDILGLTPRAARPDIASASFDLAPDVTPFTLPQGTRVEAGRMEDGTPILYETAEPLALDHSQVAQIKTLRLDRAASGALLDLRKTDIPAPVAQPFAPFGARGLGTPAQTGLVIISPLLLLDAGARQITLRLRLTGETSALCAFLEQNAGRPVSADKLGLRPALLTEEGPFVPPRASVSLEQSPGGDVVLVLTLQLSETDPALVATEEPADQMGGGQLELSLVSHHFCHGAALFRAVDIRSVEITARVTGYPLATLTTPDGDASAESPFAPLGAQPEVGTRMAFTLPKMTEGRLQEVTLTLTWQPFPPGGLSAYYSAYGLKEDMFKVSLDRKIGSIWDSGTEPQALFAPAAGTGPRRTVFDMPVTGDAARAFGIQLVAPGIGFGQRVYPALVAKSAAREATASGIVRVSRSAVRGAKTAITKLISEPTEEPPPPPVEAPNPPFTPMAEAATADFVVRGRIGRGANDRNGVLVALRPFGRYPAWMRGNLRLIDLFSYGGKDRPAALYLGLRDIGPDRRINLFVELDDDAQRLVRDAAGEAPQRLAWYYMSRIGWRALEVENILSDTTGGFERSGRLQLVLPHDVSTADPEMPPGMVWIAAAPLTDTATETIGQLRRVLTCATSARRLTDAPWASAPAGSLTRVADAAVAAHVRTVAQPVAARQGQAAESRDAFRVRVSERLRHKGRALQARDFEQIVLDQFPEIGDAKAVRVRPGTVMIALAGRRTAQVPLPRVAPHILRDVTAYLMARAQPGLSLSAVSVRYEPVRIRCWLGYDATAESSVLSQVGRSINDWIAPWLQDPKLPCPIGQGHLDPVSLHTLLERTPGVRYLTGLTLAQISKTGGPEEAETRGAFRDVRHAVMSETETAPLRPGTPFSVLVPAGAHVLHALVPPFAVNAMTVGRTFFVGQEGAEPGDDMFVHATPAGIGAMRIGREFVPAADQRAHAEPQKTESQG